MSSSGSTTPRLSVVVTIVSDTVRTRATASHLDGCLGALAEQVNAPAMEVVVPYHEGIPGLSSVRDRFPAVRFLPQHDLELLGPTGRNGREHHNELRARGIRATRGGIVGLLEDHARPDPNWSARMVSAHEAGNVAAVGGTIENGLDRALNWAVYFSDFSRYQRPSPSAVTLAVSDANVTYRRGALDSVQHVWNKVFNEPEVNEALRALGERLAFDADAVVYQYRQGLRLRDALRERFIWGRSVASARGSAMVANQRALRAVVSPLVLALLVLRIGSKVLRTPRHVLPFLRSLPLILLLNTAWTLGEAVGYVSSRAAVGFTAPSAVNSPL